MATRRKKAVHDEDVRIIRPDDPSMLTDNIIYADTMIQIGAGPFVSRVTFGSQIGPAEVVPNLQLVMPSNALLEFARNVVAMFQDPNMVHQMQMTHEHFHRRASTKLIPSK